MLGVPLSIFVYFRHFLLYLTFFVSSLYFPVLARMVAEQVIARTIILQVVLCIRVYTTVLVVVASIAPLPSWEHFQRPCVSWGKFSNVMTTKSAKTLRSSRTCGPAALLRRCKKRQTRFLPWLPRFNGSPEIFPKSRRSKYRKMRENARLTMVGTLMTVQVVVSHCHVIACHCHFAAFRHLPSNLITHLVLSPSCQKPDIIYVFVLCKLLGLSQKTWNNNEETTVASYQIGRRAKQV